MNQKEKKEWYEGYEEKDYNLLTAATSGVLFSFIERGEPMGVDAYATASTRTFDIELKYRNIKHNQYNTILIESDKYANALNNFIFDQKEQLYINFFEDGYMMIFNLLKLKHKPKYSPWRLKSENYGQVVEGRFELSVKDAILYKINSNGIVLVNER